MNKQFEYRGFNFNIKVDLNTKLERRIDGEIWHTVIINCMEIDYYKEYEVNDNFLVVCVKDYERLAKKYVDKKLDGRPSPDARLSALGFK